MLPADQDARMRLQLNRLLLRQDSGGAEIVSERWLTPICWVSPVAQAGLAREECLRRITMHEVTGKIVAEAKK